MGQITSLAQVREIIPQPSQAAYAKIRDKLCDQGVTFVRRSPFLVLATLGDYGLELSPKGDHPGFVEVLDERTLLIPERRGNQLAVGVTNMLANPQVGLMMFRPGTDEVLRISGRVSLFDDADLCERLSARGEPALFVMRVAVDRAAFHCVRSARRAGLWDPESWDAPTRISFGRIYAEALARPEIEPEFDRLTEISNAKL
jgi:PPOX class probable FMN-dependent enzyme